jgi:transposase
MPISIGITKAGMLKVDDYLQIRLLHRDGVSVRQIARRLGHGRDTVKKALVEATPRGYTRTRPVTCPKLGAFTAAIDQILANDRSAPKKQRHTAYRIFQRLRDEHGYAGGYDQVRRYVGSHCKRERETHLLLDHPPGCRMECDFGHIQVDFPEGRRQVPVLIGIWSYSHYPFAIALPDERCGSILHGTLCAFEFFGCVPAELWWDNPTTVATVILRGRDRKLNSHYASLASHYRFAPMFCIPARGQEKSDVERTVFALQRRFVCLRRAAHVCSEEEADGSSTVLHFDLLDDLAIRGDGPIPYLFADLSMSRACVKVSRRRVRCGRNSTIASRSTTRRFRWRLRGTSAMTYIARYDPLRARMPGTAIELPCPRAPFPLSVPPVSRRGFWLCIDGHVFGRMSLAGKDVALSFIGVAKPVSHRHRDLATYQLASASAADAGATLEVDRHANGFGDVQNRLLRRQ